MNMLKLTYAGGDYDRMQALTDGTIQPEGIDLNYVKGNPADLFFRMMRFEEFDASELSAASYLIAKDRGYPHFTAIPVFPSRMFRHSAIYIRRGAGISKPEDLRGKRIGVPEYHVTALIWVRGMLQHEYQVHPSEIAWYWGGVNSPNTKGERVKIQLPESIKLEAIGSEQSLNQMLLNDQLDAIISPRVPAGFNENSGKITRLFPHYAEMERQYYASTHIFPIMHLVVIKDEILAQHPWIAGSLQRAFTQAKKKAYEAITQTGSLRVTLPWLVSEVEQTRQLMGDDFWSYGMAENRKNLETLMQYAYEQGIISRTWPVEELFAPMTQPFNDN